MQNRVDALCEACDQWAARTGLPVSLVVGPLLDYSGGERDEYLDRSAASLREWFGQLLAETGMHDQFLVFAAIRFVEAGLAEWASRVDAEFAHAREHFPGGALASADIGEERRRRETALSTWRDVTRSLLAGSAVDLR